MKNAYIIEDEKIIFRRAKYTDNFIEIAELIYKTDPYIYPFWFKNDMEEAIEILSKKLVKKDLYSITKIFMLHMIKQLIK